MKNILLLALLIINVTSYSQIRKVRDLGDLKSGEYSVNVELKKYVGIWQGKYGDSTITINLKYSPRVQVGTAPNTIYFDRLEGDYIIKKGEQDIINTTGKKIPGTTPYCLSIENSSGLFLFIYPDNNSFALQRKIKRVDAITLELIKVGNTGPMFGKKKEQAFQLPESLTLQKISIGQNEKL